MQSTKRQAPSKGDKVSLRCPLKLSHCADADAHDTSPVWAALVHVHTHASCRIRFEMVAAIDSKCSAPVRPHSHVTRPLRVHPSSGQLPKSGRGQRSKFKKSY
jgi:hypothetical protein